MRRTSFQKRFFDDACVSQTRHKENLLHNNRGKALLSSAQLRALQIWNHTLIHDLFICYCSAGCCFLLLNLSFSLVIILFYSFFSPFDHHFFLVIHFIDGVGIFFFILSEKQKYVQRKNTSSRRKQINNTFISNEINRWFLQTNRSLWLICEKRNGNENERVQTKMSELLRCELSLINIIQWSYLLN